MVVGASFSARAKSSCTRTAKVLRGETVLCQKRWEKVSIIDGVNDVHEDAETQPGRIDRFEMHLREGIITMMPTMF